MNTELFVNKLMDSAQDIPNEVDVLVLRQYTLEELEERARALLSVASEVYEASWDKGEWVKEENRTLIRLTENARAVIFHASGAMKLVTGMNPMDEPFPKILSRKVLTEFVEEAAGRLRISAWAGENGYLRFERLWQIKAAASDRRGKVVEPVMFRVVGAYRHFVNDLPVWGPASMAVKLTGEGSLDSIAIQIREATGDIVDRVPTISIEMGAVEMARQLDTLMGHSKAPLDKVAKPRWVRFGYLSLSKRKVQRLLEPVYVSLVDIEGEASQGYLLVTPAAEKSFSPLYRVGDDTFPVQAGREP